MPGAQNSKWLWLEWEEVLRLGSDWGLHIGSTGRGKEKKHLFMVESLALFGTLANETWKEDHRWIWLWSILQNFRSLDRLRWPSQGQMTWRPFKSHCTVSKTLSFWRMAPIQAITLETSRHVITTKATTTSELKLISLSVFVF